MKFSTNEDIEAPLDHVWAAITNCSEFERQAMRRGAEVRRIDPDGTLGVGSEWKVMVDFRGKRRKIEARMAAFDPLRALCVHSRSGGVNGEIVAELTELAPMRTRMHFSVDLKPANLAGRLLIQSLKFARGSLNRRFSRRIGDFARGLAVPQRKAS